MNPPYTPEEDMRCRIQKMLWDRWVEFMVDRKPSRHELWLKFLDENGISVLPMDFLGYDPGQKPFLAVACPITSGCCLEVPKDFANKALLFGGLP